MNVHAMIAQRKHLTASGYKKTARITKTMRIAVFLFSILVLSAVARTEGERIFEVELDIVGPDQAKAGKVLVEVHPEWAPLGAARFIELVKNGHYNEAKFFRVIKNFMAQVGIPKEPSMSWEKKTIKDDPRVKSNKRGFVTFATAGPNTRTQQIFFNFKDNSFLDNQGFSPFGFVKVGMDIIDGLHVTGEGAPAGPGPAQHKYQVEGNAYLDAGFPKLSYIKSAIVLDSLSLRRHGSADLNVAINADLAKANAVANTRNIGQALEDQKDDSRDLSPNTYYEKSQGKIKTEVVEDKGSAKGFMPPASYYAMGGLVLFICACMLPKGNRAVRDRRRRERTA
jgi:peptidyl-prolyl cis-trans isomerase A (cyclophilin A)